MDEERHAVRLTFAELEFMLAESPGWAGGRAALGVETLTAEGRAAGMSSLIVRGAAAWTGRGVDIAPDIRVAAASLAHIRAWLEIGYRSAERTIVSYFGASGDAALRVLVSAVAPGCYEIDALQAAGSLRSQVSELAVDLLNEAAPSVLTMRDTREGGNHATVGRDQSGAWKLLDGSPGGATAMPTDSSEVRMLMGDLAAGVFDNTDAAGSSVR